MNDEWNLGEFIGRFKSAGYNFCGIASGAGKELKPTGVVYLRHDVDFSMQAAVAMAETLHSLEIKSCFFVMLTTPLYSLLTADGRDLLERLLSFGHDVRLHFDPTIYLEHEVESALNFELALMQTLTSQPQDVMSFHRPADGVLRTASLFYGVEHTYMAKWMSDIGYYADSRGRFRYGHPLQSEHFKSGKSLQVLLHPEWWFCDGDTSVARVNSALNDSKASLNAWAVENCTLLSAS
jgi:hypothetical protein